MRVAVSLLGSSRTTTSDRRCQVAQPDNSSLDFWRARCNVTHYFRILIGDGSRLYAMPCGDGVIILWNLYLALDVRLLRRESLMLLRALSDDSRGCKVPPSCRYVQCLGARPGGSRYLQYTEYRTTSQKSRFLRISTFEQPPREPRSVP